ncbi:hypothetical protein [Rhodococcus sovatensis]|uniref:Uncharacterized protein n=1 Tax=Rhodococcus sovatensis TaxID=1805840 RepID=A0ABZ2PFX2_9NOCA
MTGDESPAWANEWFAQGGGAIGGGTVDTAGADEDEQFDRVYACVGLKAASFGHVVEAGAPAQRDVRVGVADYLYRAGEVTADGSTFSVDVAVARSEAHVVRFGVAFAPQQVTRNSIDVYSGAFVVQLMREGGIL